MYLNNTLRNSIQRMFAQHFFGWSGFVSCKVAVIVLTFYVFTLFICYACDSGFGDLYKVACILVDRLVVSLETLMMI